MSQNAENLKLNSVKISMLKTFFANLKYFVMRLKTVGDKQGCVFYICAEPPQYVGHGLAVRQSTRYRD